MRDTAFQAMIPVGLIIDTVNVGIDKIMVTARADGTSAACPDCGWSSTQAHAATAAGCWIFLRMAVPSICM